MPIYAWILMIAYLAVALVATLRSLAPRIAISLYVNDYDTAPGGPSATPASMAEVPWWDMIAGLFLGFLGSLYWLPLSVIPRVRRWFWKQANWATT